MTAGHGPSVEPPAPRHRRAQLVALLALVLAVAAAVWSYRTGGLIAALFSASDFVAGSSDSLTGVREALAQWGSLAPLVYVAAVIVEVLVAPIPGTLLYAPAGALFGGFLGGLLSLAGNTIGAVIACLIGATLGERAIAKRLEGGRFDKYRELIRARGIWVVFLLRVNPLTSSDAVSYAAGLFGVPAWRVGVGTFLGMMPLCFAQAYLAERLFAVLPGSLYWLIGAGVIYVGLLVWVLKKPRRPD